MASRPVLRRITREVEEIGGKDMLVRLMAMGWRQKDIGHQLGVSRPMVSNFMRKTHGEAIRFAVQVRKERMAQLKKKVADYGLENIAKYISGGGTLKKLAAEILEVDIGNLSRHLQKVYADEMDEAYKARARIFADESVSIIDEADLDADSLRKAQLQAQSRQWLAAKDNKAAFGKESAGNLNISFGDVHLQALKDLNEGYSLPAAAEEIEEAEVEVIDD